MKSLNQILGSAFVAATLFLASCTTEPCKDVTCLNSGVATASTDGKSCACACTPGYEGTDCSTPSRTKYLGSWKGSDVCGSGTYSVTLTAANASDSTSILISNPGGFGTAITVIGKFTKANEITFTAQDLGGSRTMDGTMTFTSTSAMTTSYKVTPATGAVDNCNGTYTKQ
ncbi:MAG: hypothetical protein IPK03_09375 [Bacteroidetes bacterium]|nr:hypothetical protein [Bacteroidota bacterium]